MFGFNFLSVLSVHEICMVKGFAPLPRKKPNFGSVIFVIFLHTFKVSLLLISVATHKEAINGPKIGSNWFRNLQKRMFLKCCGCQIDEQNITLCSIDFDNFAGLVHVYFRHPTAKSQPHWCRLCWGMNFFHLDILQNLKTQFSQKYIFQNSHSVQQILMNFAGLIQYMYTSNVPQPNLSQIGVGSAEIWIFFIYISSKNLKHNFLKSTFFKIHILYACFSCSIEQ